MSSARGQGGWGRQGEEQGMAPVESKGKARWREAGACVGEERRSTGERGCRHREEEEDKRGREEMVQGPVCNRKGPDCEVEGSEQKKEEKEKGGCKMQGVGTEKVREEP